MKQDIVNEAIEPKEVTNSKLDGISVPNKYVTAMSNGIDASK